MLDEKMDKLPGEEAQKNAQNEEVSNEKLPAEEKIEETSKPVEVEKAPAEAEASAAEAEAETAEPEAEPEKEKTFEIPKIDFAALSLEELINHLENLLYRFDLKDVKGKIEELKDHFLKKFNALVKEKKEAFVKAGGNEADFHFSAPIKGQFDQLIREFKRKRQQYYKDIEREQKENLILKNQLIEDLKELINSGEPATMYKSFQDLQNRWRSIGQVPRANYNDVWRTYQHHVERFYDLLHLNKDFRDLDFKHNLEEKTKLVEKAERLAQQADVAHSFKELQILHRMWKEDIGPVAREYREDIWNRFSEATKMIHKKRHEFQNAMEEKFMANVDLKKEVIEKIKAVEVEGLISHKHWQEQIKKVEALREEFFAIGKVPKSKNEEIWQLFKSATREFNAAKNNFYKGLKKGQSKNLELKEKLVEQARAMKDSEEWAEATEFFKKIQADWKKIGHVPRKDSDRVWKEFKAACNHFFDRLHDKQDSLTKEESVSIDKKKKYLEAFKAKLSEEKLALEAIDEAVKEWRELGVVPDKVKHLEAKFSKLLDSAYKKLDMSPEEVSMMKFKNTIQSHLDRNDRRKLDSEQLFIRKKIDEITKEIKQLENNISFISNATEDNPLVKNVYKNIETQKQELAIWKKKIEHMSRLDY